MNTVKIIFMWALALSAFSVSAQSTKVSLKIINAGDLDLQGVAVYFDGLKVGETDEVGDFEMEVENHPDIISLIDDRYEPYAVQVSDRPSPIDLGQIELIPVVIGQNVVQTNEAQSDDDDQNEDISSLLTASNDLFTSSAAFNWGPLRFRNRGYQTGMVHVGINGFLLNDAENGRVNWNAMSGLNDVTRNAYGSISLSSFDFDLGDIGGAVYTDMKAKSQPKQIRASYASSNRSYRNRLMLTYSTGRMDGGWYFSASGSRRWAQEGYIDGTYYDAWGYYLGVSKEFGEKHAIHFMGFGAPVERGKSSPGIQLSYDLADDNYYNSYWGYQQGEKRNSRIGRTHLPTGLLQYEYTPSTDFYLSAMVGLQKGVNGGTALNWTDAPDPRPDYYQKLPNYFWESPEVYDALYDYLSNNPDLLQVNWDNLYNANYNSQATVENANGIEGNTVSGRLSLYNIEDRRYDPTSLQSYVLTRWNITDQLGLEGGLRYNKSERDNYKLIEDLMGSDFHLDVNKFETDDQIRQTDLNTPNRIVYEGDRHGYSYQALVDEAELWVQPRFRFANFEASLGLRGGHVTYQRNGDFRTGAFPDISYGKSEKQNFTEYAAKLDLTYKISGRHYVYANAWYSEEAPLFSNSMVSPRTRNTWRSDLPLEKRQSVEAAYVLRTPIIKAKVLGYLTEIKDRIRHQTTFLDNDLGFGEFGNILTTNIAQRHVGIEAVVEVDLGYGFEAGFATALGQHLYTDRWNWTVYTDNSSEALLESQTIYNKHFYIPGSPQNAYAFQLKYNSPKYWFASLTANYLTDRYLDFYPLRRTELATGDLERELDGDIFESTIAQEKIDPAFTLNLFGGKSWRFDETFVYLTIGVNNILNETNIITGGFEQYRFALDSNNKPDLQRFPNKYWYGYGLNYFVNLAVRI